MEDFEDQNQQLLDTLEKTDTEPTEIKMGTKQHIISEIVKVSEKTGILLEDSLTSLEKAMEKEIQKKLNLNVPQTENTEKRDQLVAIGVLRMLHDSVARGTETMCEKFTPYSIDGFSERMRDPQVSEQIDSILLQIAEENDVLQQISSPYVRLAICWGSCAMTSLKKKRSINKNGIPPNVESK